MAQSNYCRTYVSYFPRAGIDGTLKNFLKGSNLEGKIALKTGSLSGVQCYAGYKLDSDGTPTHTVVIMANNFFCKRAELRKEIENLLIKKFNNTK
jgi:D-alanyl-D-alanine carboxypeptidase/D-alanyl-D-alanine-endopeptidase (penicillin-binding protein 4)